MNEESVKNMGKTLIKLIEGKEKLETGEFSNVSDCIFGTAVMKAALEELEENLLRSFETMNTMAGEGLLLWGTHFITGNYESEVLVLKLNYKLFYWSFKEYCRKNNVSHAVFELTEFITILRSMPFCIAFNWPVWFNFTGKSCSEKRIFRSALIDVEALKDRGVCIDNLINRKG